MWGGNADPGLVRIPECAKGFVVLGVDNEAGIWDAPFSIVDTFPNQERLLDMR